MIKIFETDMVVETGCDEYWYGSLMIYHSVTLFSATTKIFTKYAF